MKAKITMGVLFVVLGAASGVATLDGGPDPMCLPGNPCQVGPKAFDGGPQPICRPGVPCPGKK